MKINFRHFILIGCAGALALTTCLSTLCMTLHEIRVILFVALVAMGVAFYTNLDERLNKIKESSFLLDIIMVLSILTIFVCSVGLKNYENKISYEKVKNLQEEVNKYSNYYESTERLLDSLQIDVDNPIMESDAGASYLLNKKIVDEKTVQ